jgi:hypothetical protein
MPVVVEFFQAGNIPQLKIFAPPNWWFDFFTTRK